MKSILKNLIASHRPVL